MPGWATKRHRLNRFAPYAKVAGQAITSLGKYVVKNPPRGRFRFRKYLKSGNGVTSQYDKTLVYRKKRMPRRKRKSWKKFVKKVRRAMEKDFGKTSVVFNHLQNGVTGGIVAPASDQGRSECHLYGFQGTIDTSGVSDGISGARDINVICSNDTRIGPSTKVKFCSAVLDATFRVTQAACELDIYEIEYNKDTNCDDIITMLTTGFTAQQITGYPNTLAITNRGTTIFDCPSGISQFGIKILKKTKYFLPEGNTCTYQMRDPKTHIFDANYDNTSLTTTGVALKKMTRSLFYIWKALPAVTLVPLLSVGVTRKYSYQILEDGSDYDGRVP